MDHLSSFAASRRVVVRHQGITIPCWGRVEGPALAMLKGEGIRRRPRRRSRRIMVIGMNADPALPALEPREQELIERADALGRGLLAENATQIDRGEMTVHENVRALAAAGIAGVTTPVAYGGSAVRPAVELRILEALAYGDATTPFVIAQ